MANYVLNCGTGEVSVPQGAIITDEFGNAISYGSGLYLAGGPMVLTDAEFGREIAAGSRSFTVSGQSQTLKATRLVTAATSSVALSGTALNLEFGREIIAGSRSVGITVTSVSLEMGRLIDAAARSLTVSATALNLEFGRKIIAAGVTVSSSGKIAVVRSGRLIDAGSQPVSVSGTSIAALFGRRVDAATRSVSVAGSSALLSKTSAYEIEANGASLAITPTATSALFGRAIVATGQAVSVSGTSANLVYTPMYTITANGAAVNVSSTNAGVLHGFVQDAQAASVSVSGSDADARVDYQLFAGEAQVISVPDGADLLFGRTIEIDEPSEVTVTGDIAELLLSQGNGEVYWPGLSKRKREKKRDIGWEIFLANLFEERARAIEDARSEPDKTDGQERKSVKKAALRVVEKTQEQSGVLVDIDVAERAVSQVTGSTRNPAELLAEIDLWSEYARANKIIDLAESRNFAEAERARLNDIARRYEEAERLYMAMMAEAQMIEDDDVAIMLLLAA